MKDNAVVVVFAFQAAETAPVTADEIHLFRARVDRSHDAHMLPARFDGCARLGGVLIQHHDIADLRCIEAVTIRQHIRIVARLVFGIPRIRRIRRRIQHRVEG